MLVSSDEKETVDILVSNAPAKSHLQRLKSMGLLAGFNQRRSRT